jgi:murein DD-endopeptidase MepM/ murein hydrolase activator NlpD
MPRKWTLSLVSRDGSDLLEGETGGRRRHRFAVGVLFTLLAGLLVAAGSFGYLGGETLQGSRLARENALLTEQLAAMQARVSGLESDLELLAERDADLRVLAGLDPIDREVLQVGVGGPGSPSPEGNPLHALNPETAEEAFAVDYDLNALERRTRLLKESLRAAGDSISAHRDRLLATPSMLPARGRLSSRFSNARQHPILNRSLPHEGVDISAPRGTPIMAVADGRVTWAGRRSGYGLVVELDHGYGITTFYGHASQTLVRVGQRVKRGEFIALIGNTGIATSTHVHYEVRVGGRPVDPMNYVIGGALP